MRHINPSSSAHVDFVVANNADFVDAVQFDPPVPGVTGPAWTLTGATFSMEVARNKTTAPLLMITSAATEIITDSEPDRVIHFDVTWEDISAALIPGLYIYDFIMTTATGKRVALMHGKFTVTDGITED